MATRVSSLAVQIDAIGVDKVKSALRELGIEGGKTSDALETHYGKAARHLSLVTNEAVRAGEIGGTALQKILTIGGDMAGMFGVSGAVVGALAVTGLAIYNYFDRARKAIEETAKTVRAELRSLEDESAMAQARDLNRAVGGEGKNAEDPLRRGSKAALEAQRLALFSRATTSTDAKTGIRTTSLSSDDTDMLEKIDKELDRRNQILKEGIPLLKATAEAEATRTMVEGKAGLVTKAESEAQQALNLAIKRGQDASESATRSIVAKLNIEDQAAATREKAGIHAPGTVDFAAMTSDTTAQLNQFAKDHPFDMEAYFRQLTAVGTSDQGLLPKIQSPLNEMATQIRTSISHTLGSAIYDGFSAAFSGKGLGGVFKAFGKTILGGLGQIITEQGMIYLEYSGIMQAFTPLLGNPFTAGFAGAAIGAALIALGAALGAAAQGGGHGSASVGSVPRPSEITNIKLTATGVADQARYDPRSTGNNYYIIGTNDPKAQRELREMVDKGGRR